MNIFSFFGQFFSYKSVFLYLGPETIMPLGSIIAAVIGFLLIGWRWIVAIIRKMLGKSAKPTPEISNESTTQNPSLETPSDSTPD